MKKRMLSILLIILLVVSILPITASAAGSLSNFTKSKIYKAGQFSDVSNQWFATDVKTAYEFSLVNGTTATTYSPNKNLTIAEAITLASSMHSIYNTGSSNFSKGSPWYQPYIDYALANGIIQSAYPNYTTNATRSDMAVIFANVLPDEAMTPINKIDNNAIPDVLINYSYGAAVYKLYRAGVLVGSGDTHDYKPNDNITRAEIAAIVARMASSSNRVSFTITSKELTSTEVAGKCSSAVFIINFLSKTGTTIRSGSGFFINSSGLAVTNYHVIKNMTTAKITMKDGKTYDVTGVYDYSEATDLALIQVNGTGFPYLELGNSDSAVTGANIFAIGYPLGVDQTVTPGTITNASHAADGINYIMINASISNGSSGGALIDAFGKVIGVTTAYYTSGQNLNLAVPINLLSNISATKSLVPLSTLFAKTFTYYAGYPMIPDFASVTGSQFFSQDYSTEYQTQYYIYSTSNLSKDILEIRDEYLDQLDLQGFDYLGRTEVDGYYFHTFNDTSKTWLVSVGVTNVDGIEYIVVMILHDS